MVQHSDLEVFVCSRLIIFPITKASTSFIPIHQDLDHHNIYVTSILYMLRAHSGKVTPPYRFVSSSSFPLVFFA